MPEDTPDVYIRNEGTLIGFEPVSDAAIEWFADNVSADSWQWFGNLLWVDHRLAKELAIAVVAVGLDLKVVL